MLAHLFLAGVILLVGVVVIAGSYATLAGRDPWNERKSLHGQLKSIFGTKDYHA